MHSAILAVILWRANAPLLILCKTFEDRSTTILINMQNASTPDDFSLSGYGLPALLPLTNSVLGLPNLIMPRIIAGFVPEGNSSSLVNPFGTYLPP